MGKQFAIIAVEELTLQKDLEAYLTMFACLRGPFAESVGFRRHMLFSCNAGGLGAQRRCASLPTHREFQREYAGHKSSIPMVRPGACFSAPTTTTRFALYFAELHFNADDFD